MKKIELIIRKLVSIIKSEKLVPIVQTKAQEDQFNGRVALISGGTGGIGISIAKTLLSSGCKVILAGTNPNKLKNVIDNLNTPNAAILELNYLEVESFDAKIEEADKIFGNIDIFVSSAGVHTEGVDFWKMTGEEYDRVMNINLKGTFFMCKSMADYMKDRKLRGNILLVSSTRGFEPAWSPYGISKWAMNGLTKGLAQILSENGITVNAIAPGSTATALIGIDEGDNIYTDENKIGRFIMPTEVAGIAKLLVSESGKMISGETIRISAGRGVWDIR
nr:SDR family oxidoreductase [uncultured Bacteroides sp.]